jgi:NADH-quinone oxidoreductase subunit J
MVFARNAVHSALCLAGTMLTLGFLYLAQGALFLGFVQIIVYTGAVMMLFLFVLMLVGRDSSDSVVEVLRGQRTAALLFGVGFAVLLVGAVGQAFADVAPAGLDAGGANWNGNVPGLGRLIFTEYLFAFELTSALLITAALGAMVLAHAQTGAHAKRGQRATVEARLRGEHARISPLPGPGVYATANSVAVPAVLPDGSIAPESLAEIIDRTEVRPPPEPAPDDAHALTGRPRSDRSGHDASTPHSVRDGRPAPDQDLDRPVGGSTAQGAADGTRQDDTGHDTGQDATVPSGTGASGATRA